PFLREVASVATPDDGTVVITLTRVRPDLPWILAQPQMAVLPAATGPPRVVAPQDLSPSGPYRLRSYVPERSIVLERNPAWDAGSDPVRTGYVDGIAASIGISPSHAFGQTVAGTADIVLDSGAPDLHAGTTAFPAGARAVRSGNGCTR